MPHYTQQLMNTPGTWEEGGRDPNQDFQLPATPMNYTLESCHEGVVFVCFRFVIGGGAG